MFTMVLKCVNCVLVVSALASLSSASIQPSRGIQSAELGAVGMIIYNISVSRSASTAHSDQTDRCSGYNCTTPNGPCYDGHNAHRYRITTVGEMMLYPVTANWQCGIEITNVTLNDVGQFMMFKNTGLTRMHVNFSVWETDTHGRICETSFNETLNVLVNNCSDLTTPQPTTLLTTQRTTQPNTQQTTHLITRKIVQSTMQETMEQTKLILEKEENKTATQNDTVGKSGKNIGDENDVCPNYVRDITLTAAGVFFGVFLVVIIIFLSLWSRRRRNRERFLDHVEGYTLGQHTTAMSMAVSTTAASNGHVVSDEGDGGYSNDVTGEGYRGNSNDNREEKPP